MSERNVQLTGETVGPSNPREVGKSLVLAALVLVVANVVALGFLRTSPQNRTYWLLEQKWKRLDAQARPVDWLVVGDSSGNQGVRPDVWTAETGGTVLNLCTIGEMLALDDAWMVEDYVSRHGPPKGGVVVVHVYDVWHRPATSALRGPLFARIPRPWGFWNTVTPKVSMSPLDAAGLLAAKYLPLYADNVTLANALLRGTWFAPPHFEMDAAGYMPLRKPSPRVVEADAKLHLEFVRKAKFKPSQENVAALARLRELAEKHRFDLHLATSPLVEELAREPMWRRYYASVHAMLKQAAGDSKYVHLALPRPVPFPAAVMENADHLTHEAAERYTRLLAAEVKAARSAPEELAPAFEERTGSAQP